MAEITSLNRLVWDRVHETTDSEGTGVLELLGAEPNSHTFADVLANNQHCFYAVVHRTEEEWLLVFGQRQDTPESMNRNTFIDGSAGPGVNVDFSAGTKDIFIVAPAPHVNAAPGKFDARLSPIAGDAAPEADQLAVAELFLVPLLSNRIALVDYDSWLFWREYILDPNDPPALDVSVGLVGVTYDAYVRDDGAGVLVMEMAAWKKVTAGNSPTAGSNKVINLADTDTLEVGQAVTVKDGSAAEIAYINAIVADTSITVDALANSYTTPDVYGYREPPARETLDGVTVSSDDWSWRYVGAFTITEVEGETESSERRRLVDSHYHPRAMKLKVVEDDNTNSYTTATWRQAFGAPGNQVELTAGTPGRVVSLRALAQFTSDTAGTLGYTSIGNNSRAVPGHDLAAPAGVAVASCPATPLAEAVFKAKLGKDFYAWLDRGGAGGGTQVWRGDNGDATLVQCGLAGWWMC